MMGVAVMVSDKYAVRQTPEQREDLGRLIQVGKSTARVTARARILPQADRNPGLSRSGHPRWSAGVPPPLTPGVNSSYIEGAPYPLQQLRAHPGSYLR